MTNRRERIQSISQFLVKEYYTAKGRDRTGSRRYQNEATQEAYNIFNNDQESSQRARGILGEVIGKVVFAHFAPPGYEVETTTREQDQSGTDIIIRKDGKDIGGIDMTISQFALREKQRHYGLVKKNGIPTINMLIPAEYAVELMNLLRIQGTADMQAFAQTILTRENGLQLKQVLLQHLDAPEPDLHEYPEFSDFCREIAMNIQSEM